MQINKWEKDKNINDFIIINAEFTKSGKTAILPAESVAMNFWKNFTILLIKYNFTVGEILV